MHFVSCRDVEVASKSSYSPADQRKGCDMTAYEPLFIEDIMQKIIVLGTSPIPARGFLKQVSI